MNSRTRALGFTTPAALLLVLATALPASATGPIGTCSSGVALTWGAGGVGIPFNPDQGDLGPVDHAAAVAAVQAAFDVWGAVPTTTVSYANAGELGVDVDITNFDPFLFPVAPDGLSAIVFDDTGEIFDLLFGPGSGILGFAGPEFFTSTCTVIESVSFLNGPSFTDLQYASDVMVHEFGHYSGLAHTQVNGFNILDGDPTGPAPGTLGDSPLTEIETMYPFYFGPGSGTDSLEKDDASGISALYPAAAYAATTGTISGTIYAPNGTTPLTGINVIARNPADPFNDAVSALSGDYSFNNSSDDPVAGQYTLTGLTPGASYLVYIDEIGPGEFSTQPRRSLREPEEYYNGANESTDGSVDDPQASTPVASVAGAPATGIDILLNALPPGPVALGDDDAVEIFPDKAFNFCGIKYDSFFINSNGSVSFGAGDTSFVETDQDFLIGPPRIAMLWDDLNPAVGGTVSWNQTPFSIDVRFENVPEFGGPTGTGSNSFGLSMITVPILSLFQATYGAMSATDGLAGFSCGGRDTSSYERVSDLSASGAVLALQKAAVYEKFVAASPNDLSNRSIFYIGPPLPLRDQIESGNDIATDAYPIQLPFSTADLRTKIEPLGNDVDFYKFRAQAGDIIVAELVPGNPNIDMYLGLLAKDGPDFVVLFANDDGGAGFLSRFAVQIAETGTYYLGVTTFSDPDFTGDGVDFGRYVLNVVKYRGDLLAPDDDDFTEVPLGFNFPFNATPYASVFVNSNGNLTFGAGDGDFSPSVPELLAGAPRISPLWSDLSPQFGLIITEAAANRMIIHYASVPEFFDDRPNYFSVELNRNGRVRTGWLASSRGSSLVGVSQGNGAVDPGPVDLSSAGSWPVNGTTYQQFTGGAIPFFTGAQFSDFDLFFRSLIFRP